MLLPVVRGWFPSGDAHLDAEAARFLAMAEDDGTPCRPKSRDVDRQKFGHRATCTISLCTRGCAASAVEDAAAQVADALLGLDRKLEGQAQRNKQNWNARLVEVLDGTHQE